MPASEAITEHVAASRQATRRIIGGEDDRLVVVVGPCSIHDPTSALEYAERLLPLRDAVADKLFVIMRVYFEKPRTTVGWKGLIYDPHMDGSHRINEGLRSARRLLVEITEAGLPTGTEFLDATFGQYYTDLISWGAIGARTVESQIHRQLASALSMPVGIKNRTDGDVQVAVDAIQAASHRHLFPTLSKEGAPAILETTGNPDCHLVLRGGTRPNYKREDIDAAADLLEKGDCDTAMMIDCSHANSEKQPERQVEIAKQVATETPREHLCGLMIESHLVGGRQDVGGELVYGQSVTDACLAFTDTERLLKDLAEAL